MPDIEEYVEEIKDLWDSHWLTNMGAKHKEFQKQLETFSELNMLPCIVTATSRSRTFSKLSR